MLNWKVYFSLRDVENNGCSPECIDFIKRCVWNNSVMIRLVTSADQRMGRNGVEEIMNHPWLRYAFKPAFIIAVWIGRT